MSRTILQPGVGPSDLFVFCHIAAAVIREKVSRTTSDAVVVELWGNGTSAYKPLLSSYGGSWPELVRGVETAIGKEVDHTCLTTWSAGSQVAKDVCVAASRAHLSDADDPFLAETPDAIVMLDGLYGAKPPGARRGDGQVVVDAALRALARYAIAAARGDKVMVVFHSRIGTDYASSKECAEALQRLVEAELGAPLGRDTSLDATHLDGHGFVEAFAVGGLHVVEFAGVDAQEHIAEAHLFDEVWRLWLPWATTAVAPADVTPITRRIARTVPALALELSLAEEAAMVGETPRGSNQTKPAYWVGTTRLVNGKELLTKVLVGPWCAASFQWATYEAARQLGVTLAWSDQTCPVPHGARISVAELQADFVARGLYRPKRLVLEGLWEPEPGDAVLLDRAGTASKDFGHVARYVRRIDAEHYQTVGGNESGTPGDVDGGVDRWRITTRRFDDVRLRGFGEFPEDSRPAAPEFSLTAEERAQLDGLLALSIDRLSSTWLTRLRDSDGFDLPETE